jgi:flagellar protein FliS
MNQLGNYAGANEYQQLRIRTELESASPHRIIQLMMEGVLTRVAMAKGFMERGALAEKGQNISAAIDIISGLQASLNHKPDLRLSSNFDALYDYMSRRLVESNLKNDAAGLTEVADLMREIKTAWDVVGEELGDSGQAPSTGT